MIFVTFMFNVFQESRRDREVDRLFKILERVTEIKDTETNKCQSLADIHIPKLSAELQVAESIADTLLAKRLKAEADITAQLEKKRHDRTIEWDTFVHDMTNKCIRIDNTFKGREDEVRELYKKAEEKLHQQQQKNQPEEESSAINSQVPVENDIVAVESNSTSGETKDLNTKQTNSSES